MQKYKKNFYLLNCFLKCGFMMFVVYSRYRSDKGNIIGSCKDETLNMEFKV